MTAKVVDASALGALLFGEPDGAAIADVRVVEFDLAEVPALPDGPVSPSTTPAICGGLAWWVLDW